MAGINENNYYVIEFVEPCNSEKYGVVPHSWVKSGQPTKGVVVVSYPKEKPLITRERVKRNEECREKWKTYVATVKHICSDFEDANWKLNWIVCLNEYEQKLNELSHNAEHNNSPGSSTGNLKTMNNNVSIKNEKSIEDNNVNRSTHAPKRKISNCNQDTPSNSKIQKAEIKNNDNGTQNQTPTSTVKNKNNQETFSQNNSMHVKSSKSSHYSNQLRVQSCQQNIEVVPKKKESLLKKPNTKSTQETALLPSTSKHISSIPVNSCMQTKSLHSEHHVPVFQNSINENSNLINTGSAVRNLSNITSGDNQEIFKEANAELYQNALNNRLHIESHSNNMVFKRTINVNNSANTDNRLCNRLPEQQFQQHTTTSNTNPINQLNEHQNILLIQNQINPLISSPGNIHNLQPSTCLQLSGGKCFDRNPLQENIEKRPLIVQNKPKQNLKSIIKWLLQEDKIIQTEDLGEECLLLDQQKTTSTQTTTINNTSSDIQNPSISPNQQGHVKSSNSKQLLHSYTDYPNEGSYLQECAQNLPTNTNNTDERECPQNISQYVPSAVQNPSKAINSGKHNSPPAQNRSDLDTSNKETVNGRSIINNCIIQSNSCEITTENRSSRINDSQSLTDPSILNEKLIPHTHTGNNIERTAAHISQALISSAITLEKMIEIFVHNKEIDNNAHSASLKMPPTSTTSTDTTKMEKRRKDNKGKHVNKSYNNADGSLRYDDSKNHYVPNKRLNSNCSLVLPPEYNPNDTRWTLKQPEFDLGIVELTPRSKVFISATEYAHCINRANNSKSLVQMLLTSIFSDRALRVCSLLGENKEPQLDKHATKEILKFVAVYGIKKDWRTHGSKTMTEIINNTIRDMRSKGGRVNNEI